MPILCTEIVGTDTMGKRSKAYIWQFVIGLGFFSGVWTAIGIDPGSVILNVVGAMIEKVYSYPVIRVLLIVLPTVLLVISIVGAYRRGRVLGLVSVIIAYISGIFILISVTTSAILLIIAICTGCLATNRRLKKKLTGT
jgi:hypothetical protein